MDQVIHIPTSATVTHARSVTLLDSDKGKALGGGCDSSGGQGEDLNISEIQVIPEYLMEMFQGAVKNLDEKQILAFKNLFLQYVGVFTEDDFDLGHFNVVQHAINTGDAKLIKQELRRTSLHFVGEEKKASSNGQVERFNRTLMDAVPCFVFEREEWDLYLLK